MSSRSSRGRPSRQEASPSAPLISQMMIDTPLALKESMSKKKPTSFRGPSRPIDPRRAPGLPSAKRRDPFGMIMIGASAVFVLVVVVLLALRGNGATNTTGVNTTSAGNESNPSLTTVTQDPGAQATAAEVDFLTKVADVPRLSAQETKALYDSGNLKIIDVRVATEYSKDHIKGAVNIPQADAGKRVAEIPKTGNVLVYCDCPNDEESAATAKSLMNAGYSNVKVLRGPYALALWKQAGYPTEPTTR